MRKPIKVDDYEPAKLAAASNGNSYDRSESAAAGGCITPDLSGKYARFVIEQSKTAVASASERILAAIEQSHACYDYCASWKELAPDEEHADEEVHRTRV